MYNWHISRTKGDAVQAFGTVVLLSSFLLFIALANVAVTIVDVLGVGRDFSSKWVMAIAFLFVVLLPNAYWALKHKKTIFELQRTQNGPQWLWHPSWLWPLICWLTTLALTFVLLIRPPAV